MKHIKNNPPLSLSAIKRKIKTPFDTLIVPPVLEKVANELLQHFIHNVFKFELDGRKVTLEEAIELHLMDFRILTERKLKDSEWLLITDNEIYYSAGDSSNN